MSLSSTYRVIVCTKTLLFWACLLIAVTPWWLGLLWLLGVI